MQNPARIDYRRSSYTNLSTASVNNWRYLFCLVRWRRLAALLLLCLLPGSTVPAQPSDAADYLVFESVLDGRCHILSEGGKLTLLKSTHPTLAIRYRLERLFADRPQGLIDGVIKAADGVQKLGCDKVGGRSQRWRIKRATLIQE